MREYFRNQKYPVKFILTTFKCIKYCNLLYILKCNLFTIDNMKSLSYLIYTYIVEAEVRVKLDEKNVILNERRVIKDKEKEKKRAISTAI